MDDKLRASAENLLKYIADHNGNIFSDYCTALNYNQKVKLNRLVKDLFNQLNNNTECKNSNKHP